MAFIDNDSYLEYLQDINKTNTSNTNQLEINNYIKLSFESGKDEKSVLLDGLLNEESLNPSIRIIFNKFIKANFNTDKKDILRNKDLIKLAKTFAVVAKTYSEKYSFSFYGLTFEMFLPSGDYSKQQKINIALSKLRDYKIILKRLKITYYQQFELFQIKNGSVNEYMSNKLYKMKLEDKERVAEYLNSKYIEIDDEEYTLLDLQNKAKENKINELMMVKNYINTYQQMGWVARFITVTNKSTELPRAYNVNDKEHWDGITTAEDNARRLQKTWRNIQVRAKKHGIKMIGITAREPHKKGGVHQHFLVLVAPENACDCSKIREMTKCQSKNKLGKYKAIKKEIMQGSLNLEKMFLHSFCYTNRSCKIDVLDGQGKNNNVVNYITKYIMKTINVVSFNGTELDDSEKKINKISFHRTTWRYRAYSFFGFENSLTKWRLIRKMKHQVNNLDVIMKKDELLANLINCIANNDYNNFIELSQNVSTFKFLKENKHGEKVITYCGLNTFNSIYVYKHYEDEENYFDELEMFSKKIDIELTIFEAYEIKSK